MYLKRTRHPRNSVLSFGFALVTAAAGAINVTPTQASLTTTPFAPAVAAPVAVNPGSATLTATLFAPTVTASNHQAVVPLSATLAVTLLEPTVTASAGFDASLLQTLPAAQTRKATARAYRYGLLSSGFSYPGTTSAMVEPGTRSVTLTRFAPAVELSVGYTPELFRPIISERARDARHYDPRREYHKWSFGITDARLVLPSWEQLAQSYRVPPAASQSLGVRHGLVSLWVPQAQQAVSVVPGAATLTISPFAPTVQAGNNQEAIPTTRSLTTSLFAPTVGVSGNHVLTPDVASLILASSPPTVTLDGPSLVTPGSAALAVTTFAPSVGTGQSETPVILYGGDDAPKKNKRRKKHDDFYRDLEQTIKDLLSPNTPAATETAHPVCGAARTSLDLQLEELLVLAKRSHESLRALGQIKRQVEAIAKKKHEAALEEEDTFMIMF